MQNIVVTYAVVHISNIHVHIADLSLNKFTRHKSKVVPSDLARHVRKMAKVSYDMNEIKCIFSKYIVTFIS